jgi:glycosyltransferase involved in cell wall biosynthesis
VRILHTESSCGWGGQELRILTEAQGLIKRGHDVSLVCPAQATISSRAKDFGLRVHALPIERKTIRGLVAMRRFLKSHSFDVINTHSSTDSWLTALACASMGQAAPIVRTRHISTPMPNSAATRWLYMKAASKVITTGEALRQQLARDYGFALERMVSVPTGIDLNHYRPGHAIEQRQKLGVATGPFTFGIVATLRQAKGHNFLFEALAQAGLPNWQLLVMGDGPMRDRLERQIDGLGLRAKVHMVGNQVDVMPWLQALDVFVLPTLHEGVPQSLAQAMACGLCCVTTPVGGIPELVADDVSALMTMPRDVAQLRSALQRVATDAGLRQRLGQAALEAARAKCSDQAMCDAMERVFIEASGKAMHHAH